MTQKITLLYVKETGHILSAVIRNAAPETQFSSDAKTQAQKNADLEQLIGDQLIISYFADNEKGNYDEITFYIDKDQLDIATMDLVDDWNEILLKQPWYYQIKNTKETFKIPIKGNSPEEHVCVEWDFSKNHIKVKITTDVQKPPLVWINIKRNNENSSGENNHTSDDTKTDKDANGTITSYSFTFSVDIQQNDKFLVCVTGFNPMFIIKTNHGQYINV